MPRGARSTPLKTQGGRLVSARAKIGGECSQAMSVWVRSRNAGQAVAQEIFKILAGCRAKSRALSKSRDHAIAGNDLKSQVWAKRAQAGLSGAARDRLAAEKRGQLMQARAARATARAAPPRPRDAGAARADGGFAPKQESAAGMVARARRTIAANAVTKADDRALDARAPGSQGRLAARLKAKGEKLEAARADLEGARTRLHEEHAARSRKLDEIAAGARAEARAKVDALKARAAAAAKPPASAPGRGTEDRARKARILAGLRKQLRSVDADLVHHNEEWQRKHPGDDSRRDRLDEKRFVEKEIARLRTRAPGPAAGPPEVHEAPSAGKKRGRRAAPRGTQGR
jgi:hypothetical protein